MRLDRVQFSGVFSEKMNIETFFGPLKNSGFELIFNTFAVLAGIKIRLHHADATCSLTVSFRMGADEAYDLTSVIGDKELVTGSDKAWIAGMAVPVTAHGLYGVKVVTLCRADDKAGHQDSTKRRLDTNLWYHRSARTISGKHLFVQILILHCKNFAVPNQFRYNRPHVRIL